MMAAMSATATLKLPQADDDRILITGDEVCRLLGISPATLYRLANSGRLPRVRIFTATRYRLSDVHAFAETGEAVPR